MAAGAGFVSHKGRIVNPKMLAHLLDALPCAVAVYSDPQAAAVWTNEAARDGRAPASLVSAEDALRRIALPDDHTALVWPVGDDALADEMQQFAHMVSHDLQAPARTIAAYLDLLVEEHGAELQGEAAEFVDFAVMGAHQMQALLAGILAWSRVESRAAEHTEDRKSVV